MTRAEAHAVGLKARRDAGTLKEEITNAHRQAGRKASKLAAMHPARAQLKEEAAQKEQTLLRAVIELPLPSPAQQPRSNATGARKRKRESPPPALVALEERLDAAPAEAECKVARKAEGAQQG